MENLKIKWNGELSTLVRTERGGAKVTLKKGDTAVVSKDIGEDLCKRYKDFEIAKVEEKKEVAPKKEVKKD